MDFNEKDIEKNKNLSLLSYISFLFLVPLFKAKDSKYASFHAKQGKSLFVFELIVLIVKILNDFVLSNFIPLGLNIAISFVVSVSILMSFTLSVYGVIKVVKGEAAVLPIIGKFAK